MTRTSACAFVAAIALAAPGAGAADPSTVDYRAPPVCPDRAAFLAEVRARTDRFRESEGAPRKFIVRLSMDDDRARGLLAIERDGTRGAPRAFDAKSCIEAVRALSFMVALVVDPDATPPPEPSSDESATRSAATAPHDPQTPQDESAGPMATAASGVVPEVPKGADPHRARKSDEEARTRRRPSSTRWSVGLSIDTLGLGMPGPVLGGGLFVGVSPVAWLDVRGSIHQTLSHTVTAMGTSSSFAWTTGRVQPCVKVLRTSMLDLGPCLHLDVGRISAEGGGVLRTEDASRLWAAGGLTGLGQLVVVDAILLELSMGIFAPLERADFAYRPSFVVYRPPAVGVTASLGAAFSWR